MDADEITRQPLDHYERSAKALGDKKNCIWVCALRLMEARHPEATAHVSKIGHRIGLSEYEINSATRNAARRTGFKGANSDVRDVGDNSDDPWAIPEDTSPVLKPPAPCRVHAKPGDWWPSDHPDCDYCRKADKWLDTHEYDHRKSRYVEKH